MSNSAIALTVNINSLIEAGWSVELETGKRGGDIRSWITLRNMETGKQVKLRAQHTDVTTALLNAMKETEVVPWDPCSALETRTGEQENLETVRHENLAPSPKTGLACDHNGKILGHRLTCAINQQKVCDCDIGPRRVPACSTCGVEPCVCHERHALNRGVTP